MQKYVLMKAKKQLTTPEENELILKTIAREPIGDQQTLLEKLVQKGVDMNQSTLSRRLKSLGIIKKQGAYVVASQPVVGVKGVLRKVDIAPPNLMVLHTPPGQAQALAYELDYMSQNDPESLEKGQNKVATFSEILGTIAGDDTVLVICRSEKDLRALKKKVEEKWF